MSRNLMAVAAAVALLGGGYAAPTRVYNRPEPDPETERRVAKARAEREAQREDRIKRIETRRREENRRAIERVEKYNAGIDPTNDRPLSRQQRRRIARKGLPVK